MANRPSTTVSKRMASGLSRTTISVSAMSYSAVQPDWASRAAGASASRAGTRSLLGGTVRDRDARMLRKLYDRLMVLAASKSAPAWLAVVSFAESSFFPAPPDLMLAPMVLAKPEHAWRNAAICSAASVAGGMLGYAIGYFLQPVGQAVLAFVGHADGLDSFKAWFAEWGLWVILLKGLTPFPYKVITIAAGLAHFHFGVFIVASVVTRSARFFLVAGLLKWFGPPIREFVEKRLTLVTTVVAVALVALILAVKYFPH